jgi:hypothetical protein
MSHNKDHDPHPSDEEHYDEKPHPGGAHPPTRDIGPNDAIHDGKIHPKSEVKDKSGYRT